MCFWECRPGSIRSPYNSHPTTRNSSGGSSRVCLQLPLEFTAIAFDISGTMHRRGMTHDMINALADDITVALQPVSMQVITLCVLAGSVFDTGGLIDIVQQHVVQSSMEAFYTFVSITSDSNVRRRLLQEIHDPGLMSSGQVHGLIIIDNTHLSASNAFEYLNAAVSASLDGSGLFTTHQIVPVSVHHVGRPRANPRTVSINTQRIILYTSTAVGVVVCASIMLCRVRAHEIPA